MPVFRAAKPGSSRQKKYGGGSFASERQRRFMFATVPRAAHKWAHDRTTNKSDWVGRFRANSAKRQRP